MNIGKLFTILILVEFRNQSGDSLCTLHLFPLSSGNEVLPCLLGLESTHSISLQLLLGLLVKRAVVSLDLLHGLRILRWSMLNASIVLVEKEVQVLLLLLVETLLVEELSQGDLLWQSHGLEVFIECTLDGIPVTVIHHQVEWKSFEV